MYDNDELEILSKLRKTRMDIIDTKTKDGPITDNRDIRVVNEVATALENSIHTHAANRIKYQESTNTEAMLDLVAETLKMSANIAAKHVERTLDIPKENTDIITVDGELNLENVPLELEDFVTK